MKIKTIQGAQIKGGDFKYDVGSVTVFVGASFSGKTRILDAVRLGLLGYHPKLGKRPGDALRLAQGGKMGVVLEFEDPLGRVERTWWTDGGVARTQGPDVPIVSAVALDCREYFGMTGPERMRYVFGQIDLEKEVTDQSVLMRLRAVQVEAWNPDKLRALDESEKLVRELAAARRDEDATVQEWIDEVIVRFQERKKAADAACKQFAGLTQGTAQLRAAADEAPARNVQAALLAAREEAGKLRGNVQSTRAALEYNKATANRIVWLEGQTVSDTAVQETALRSTVKGYEEQISNLETVSAVSALSHKAAHESSGVAAMSANLDKLAEDLKELERSHAADLKLDCCPFCKSKAKGWRAPIVKEFQKQKAALEADITSNTAILAKQQKVAEAAHAVAKQAQEQEAKVIELRRLLAIKRRDLDALVADARKTADLMTELKTLRARPEQAASPETLAAQESALEAANEKVDELAHEDRRYVAAKAREAQAHEANSAHAVQQARAEVFKLAIGAMRDLQQEMIDKAIGGLLETANAFTAGILKGSLDYRDGDIGYWAGTTWVSHECFSGTEEALSYAGLSVALAQRAPFRLVMIDELGIVDDHTKKLILLRLVQLQRAAVVDQVLCADVAALSKIDGVDVQLVK